MAPSRGAANPLGGAARPAYQHPMWLLVITACTSSAPKAGSGPVLDSDASSDSAPDSAPAAQDSSPLESVPGSTAAPDTDALCQLALTCDVLPTRDTKVPCTLRVANVDGRVDWDGPAEVWVRGRSSSSVAKPGYGVELHDAAGDPVSADLLGMGGESDWVIDGLYYDRLLVRDKLGYDLFRSWHPDDWTAESALCELTRNGEYFGVHALVERVKRDDDRIDIADGATTGDSFVLTQIDEDCFYPNRSTYGCWKLVSPDDGDLTPDGEAALRAWLTAWEDEVLAVDAGADPSGLWNYLDMDNTVDTILLEELFKNEDAFYTSMHLWKDAGGTVHYVPWDLDMTFGQFPYYPYGDYGNPEVWIDYRPTLWSVLAKDPAFNARLAERWAELRADSLAEEALYAEIDRLQGILGDAIDRNVARWPIETINYGGWFYEVTSYEDEDAHVRAWVATRLAWMDANVAAWGGGARGPARRGHAQDR